MDAIFIYIEWVNSSHLQILVAIILLIKWADNMKMEENKYQFFDIFSGASNCSKAWTYT